MYRGIRCVNTSLVPRRTEINQVFAVAGPGSVCYVKSLRSFAVVLERSDSRSKTVLLDTGARAVRA